MCNQWRIQDFPEGGREPSRGGVNTPNFPENCMKSKEFGRPGGGRASLTPPPRSANGNSNLIVKYGPNFSEWPQWSLSGEENEVSISSYQPTSPKGGGGGAQNYYLAKFSRILHENERNGTEAVRPYHLLGSANGKYMILIK